MRPASFSASRRRADRCGERRTGDAGSAATASEGVPKSAQFRLFGHRASRFRRPRDSAFGCRSGARRSARMQASAHCTRGGVRDAIAFSLGKNRCFFFRRASCAPFARGADGRRARRASPGRRTAPENFSAKWLTSQNCVISFRPTLNCCGKESSRNDRQLAPPRRPLPATSWRWMQGSLPPRNGRTTRMKVPDPAPGPVMARAFSRAATTPPPHPRPRPALPRCATEILPWLCLCDWASKSQLTRS